MKKNTSLCKRVGAIALCLTMLCGTVIGTGALISPVSVAADVGNGSENLNIFSWTVTNKIGFDTATGKYTMNTPDDSSDDQSSFKFSQTDNDGLADKTTIINAIDENFDVYYNNQSNYYQMEVGSKTAYDGQTKDYGWFGSSYANSWLQRPVDKTGGTQNMRLITSLVPKYDDKAFAFKNFETTFKVRFDGTNDVSFLFGFRQATPGKFVDGYFNVNKEQGLIVVNRTGIVISGGEDIFSGHSNNQPKPGDMYNTDATATFATAISGTTVVTVTVRAVGEQVTVSVASSKTTFYEGTVSVPYTQVGYLAYGVANRGGDLGNITLTHLDEDGDPLPINEMTYDEQSLQADTWGMSFTDLPGAEYTDGKYAATNHTSNVVTFDQFADTKALDYLSEKADFYYNHQGSHYGQVPLYGNAGGATESGNWQLSSNRWLQRVDVSGAGKYVDRINAFVPKDTYGEQAQMKNLSATFKFRFDDGAENGAVLFGFRQKNPAKFVNSATGVNQEQALVAITQKSVAVAGGKDVTAERFCRDTQFADDDFGDVFSSALPQEVLVKIKAVGTKVTVQIFSVADATKLYSGTFTVNYTKEGYMAFGIAAAGGSFGALWVNRLDDDGQLVDFSVPYVAPEIEKFSFSVTDLIEYKESKYTATKVNADGSPILGQDNQPVSGSDQYTFADKFGETYHPDASTVINYIDNKMALYYNHQSTYVQMQAGVTKAYDGQTSDITAFSRVMYNKWLMRTGSFSSQQNFRLINSLVPRNSVTGEELVLKNFETTFEIRFESSVEHENTALLGFRQATPGKFVDGYWQINTEQAFVAVTRFGITIAGGDQIVSNRARDPETGEQLHKSGEGDMYNEDQTAKFETMLPQQVKIYVKAVGDKVTVKITNLKETTTYYDNSAQPATVNRAESGYLAYGLGSKRLNIADIELYRLDENGERININGSDTVVDCPWDTSVERYSETMNTSEEDIATLFDFYYSAMVGDTAITKAELLTDHWKLNDSKILMRQNDLNPNATANVALMTPKDTKLSNFDACFKLAIDEKQEGTFWVTARQSDASKVGKIVETPGDTDYVEGQIAVGFAVGGDITIVNGSADPIVISGPNVGTPSGTYTYRVRVYGEKVEVYVNGQLRVVRVLRDAPTGEGYVTFGYSGAALGIGSVDITKMDENGVPVNFVGEYVSVDTFTDRILVAPGTADTEVLAKLPTALTARKADNSGTEMTVYWDLSTLDLNTDGDYKVIGYLNGTNDVRAVATVLVGTFDRDITAQYTFDDETALDSFESWFMPTTNGFDQSAIHTEGTENDAWTVTNGKLSHTFTNIRLTNDELVNGKEINGELYKNDSGTRAYASNFGIAVLKDKAYTNFILEVDAPANSNWNFVGFGAKDFADAKSVFSKQVKGGYSFHVEKNAGTDSGTAKCWGYMPDSNTTGQITKQVVTPYTPVNGTMHHIKIIVSDGHVWYYFNNSSAPYEMDLPSTYEGGYIFLACNQNGAAFDNLRITDLDAKDIQITTVLTPEPDMAVIDRSLGESLAVDANGLLRVADENGYKYDLPYSLVSDTYRSNKEGRHTFTAEFSPLHGMVLADGLKYEVTVDNRINGDYDTAKSVKYYFDHPNDFLDFYSQYSEPRTVDSQTYYSAYDGDLVTIDFNERWTVADGKATTNYTMDLGAATGESKARGVSTLVLKDLNLVNYRVEMDFMQGSGIWYAYMLVGVQNPNKCIGPVDWNGDSDGVSTWEKWVSSGKKTSTTAADPTLGGGVWTFLEKEGHFWFWGAVDGNNNRVEYTEDISTDFIATYDKTKEHHMVVEMVNGLLSMTVDYSDTFYVGPLDAAWGGLVGFGANGNGSTYDNFQITALDENGEEIPLEDAQRGWAPEQKKSNYDGWQPTKEEWEFVWGDKYEK